MAALCGEAGPQARFTPDPFTVKLGVTVVAEAGPSFETATVMVADWPPFSQAVPVAELAAVTLVTLSWFTSNVIPCWSACGCVGEGGKSCTWTVRL